MKRFDVAALIAACFVLASGTSAIALEDTETALNANLSQVTSVSQLSDVNIYPNHWAYQALRSLVERYSCIVGYPDATYRGNQYLTRYEFAAGLNACLDRVQELIRSNTGGFATKEDLETLKRLQEEFAAELAILRGRVDTLEARTATLEKQQFSTTTKLNGQLLFYVADIFGDDAGPANNTTASYRIRLGLTTSFNGRDTLITQLQAKNIQTLNTATRFPNAFRADGVPSFGLTDGPRLVDADRVSGDGSLGISALKYSFSVTDAIKVVLSAVDAGVLTTAAIDTFADSSSGTLSNFGQVSPLLSLVGTQAGIGVITQITPRLSLDFGYLAGNGANNPAPQRGLFNGSSVFYLRPVFIFGNLRLAAAYVNSYSIEDGIGSGAGSNPARLQGVGPVVADVYSVAAFYRITPTIELGGSISYADAKTLRTPRGSADVWTYDISLGFLDAGKKGNKLGFIFGMQPRLTGTSTDAIAQAVGLEAGQRSDRDVGFHIEAFYTFQLTDNIAITPGVFWLTAPNHDQRNADAVVGAIRTTISF